MNSRIGQPGQFLWVNMNTETGSPERLEERDIEGYQMERPWI